MSDTQSWLHTNTRRLDQYFRWSLYPVPLGGLAVLAFVIRDLIALAPWQQVVLWVLFVLAGVASLLALIRALSVLEEQTMSAHGKQVAVWTGFTVTTTTLSGVLVTPSAAPAILIMTVSPLVLIATFRVALGIQTVALVVTVACTAGLEPASRFAILFMVVVMISTVWLCAWTLRVVWSLDSARQTAARLAVAEERLRFSRDLHDVFGRVLSSVAVKSELAAGLAERGRSAEAAAQMREVHQVAEQAGKEVREVVRGYRQVDFAQELHGAKSVLAAGGVRCEIDIADADLDRDSSAALGWVVREGVTNVLRHSDATVVTISLSGAPGEGWRLTLTNDGAHPAGRSGNGSGLLGLQERLQQVGGAMHTDVYRNVFTLLAEVPPQQRSGRRRPVVDDGLEAPAVPDQSSR
ncbi:sensor histidine kinase [Naumannella halotolerans]|uniref:sensor histidine kinase n=1 Tax=Naumannella halotolerans TaxID=993414 RepID=UPI00370DB6AE